MSSLVVVAIPAEDDPVWVTSSERVPHLTLVYLGEHGSVVNTEKIVEFLEHAAKTILKPFGLDVERRGILGDDEADVIFFAGWDLPELKQFRAFLLQEPNIAKAHLAVKQFPEWLPHLTLGYPERPAKPPRDIHDRITWVRFDRVALWTSKYEGPEFSLKKTHESMEVSMSSLDDGLAHYGVKGMKWGKRKAPSEVTVRTDHNKIKTSGGVKQPAHPDAAEAKVAIQKLKKSGPNALSNRELKLVATRLNLEKQVSDLGADELTSNGERFMQALFVALAKP